MAQSDQIAKVQAVLQKARAKIDGKLQALSAGVGTTSEVTGAEALSRALDNTGCDSGCGGGEARALAEVAQPEALSRAFDNTGCDSGCGGGEARALAEVAKPEALSRALDNTGCDSGCGGGEARD